MYATVKGTSELLGARSILSDFGIDNDGHVMGDASAALGVIKRHGLGRLRHVDCSYLWVQEMSASKSISFSKVKGESNPADCLTKHLGVDVMVKHIGAMSCDFPSGINEFGLKLDVLSRSGGYTRIGDGCSGSAGAYVGQSKWGVVHTSSDAAWEAVGKLVSEVGRADTRVWSRHDIASSTFRSTSKNGPDWRQVVGRVTVEAGTGHVIEARRTVQITRQQEHARLPSGRSDIVTYLLFVDDRWDARS